MTQKHTQRQRQPVEPKNKQKISAVAVAVTTESQIEKKSKRYNTILGTQRTIFSAFVYGAYTQLIVLTGVCVYGLTGCCWLYPIHSAVSQSVTESPAIIFIANMR